MKGINQFNLLRFLIRFMLVIIRSIVNIVTLQQSIVKHSGIPSVNVCMNCHKNIAEVAEDLLKENIRQSRFRCRNSKIIQAAGWDAENLEYTGETTYQMDSYS